MKKLNKNIFYLFLTLCTMMFFLNYQSLAANIPNEESSYIFIPAGAKCEGIIAENIDYSSAVTGQNVTIILLKDFKYGDKFIAPSDSVISGNITKKNMNNGKISGLKIRFTSIRTPYNNVIPVNSLVVLDNKEDKQDLIANEKITILFNQPITIGAK